VILGFLFAPLKTNMNNYLIYYADQDPYEGRDSFFAVTETEERAKEICADIINYGKNLGDELKYEFEDGISEEQYADRLILNDLLKEEPWPHGWSPRYADFNPAWAALEGGPITMTFDERTVAYQEIKKL
jgi:hypothetical protein